MVRPLSCDLRDRVVAMVREGASMREAAKAFSVSVASVVRWSQRERATGNTQPLAFGHRRGLVLTPQREWLLARLAAAPDLTVRALRAELETQRDVRVGYGAVWRWLTKEGLTFKKKPACRRAAQAGRSPQARPLASAPAPDRPSTPGFRG